MPNVSVRNLARIRQMWPEIGEAISDLQNAQNNVAQQVNASPVGTTPAPQPHSKLVVVGGGGIIDVAVTDNSEQYHGNHHFFDYTMDGWKTFHTKPMGPAKNWRGALGSGKIETRSYTQYPTSPPSSFVYHAAVDTSIGAEPAMQAGQGSGTGLAGFGEVPYNAVTPPKRA